MFASFLAAEGPNTGLLWLLYAGLAFLLLVIVVGWLTSPVKREQVGVRHEASKVRGGKSADDLTKIEGVGPKVRKVLKGMGIETFDDLARAKASEVQETLNAAGLQMMNPEGWIDQAKLAAKGDWAGFDKLQRKLKGGRRVK
ncbi:MAG TPA: helix-hairpin-helix domain-containing protein [Anaerolineales bacterium]|nr:helix-hairpin-helix domain-containing protein [Anaerolineales bacterium]